MSIQFEIEDAERRQLRDFMGHPGYKVLQKVLNSYVAEYEDFAMSASRNNPLGQPEEVARRWAYVCLAEQLVARVEQGLKFEVSMLTPTVRQQFTEEQARLRRQHIILGELDPPPDFKGEAQ